MVDLSVEQSGKINNRAVETKPPEPSMMGFMRSLVYDFKMEPDLELWEQADLFREEVEVPLTKFCTWVKSIAVEFSATHDLKNDQLGKLIIGKKNTGVSVRHDATQIEASGNDKKEAISKLKSLLRTQLTIWEEEGNLKEQFSLSLYKDRLIRELKDELS